MQRSAIIGAIVMCAVLGVWMGVVMSTAEGSMTCPSTPAWVAAGMRITTVANSSCDKVLGEMEARVNGQSVFTLLTKTWQDPHNNGWYTSKNYGGSFSTSRLTSDSKYRDKQIFTLRPHAVGCNIEACSRSQVRSYSDHGTNYCNLKMLFCGTADGCKFVNDDLIFVSESTKKFSQASVDLKQCFGKAEELTEGVVELEAQPESTSTPESKPAEEATEKTVKEKTVEETTEEPSEKPEEQTTGKTTQKTAKKNLVV